MKWMSTTKRKAPCLRTALIAQPGVSLVAKPITLPYVTYYVRRFTLPRVSSKSWNIFINLMGTKEKGELLGEIGTE